MTNAAALVERAVITAMPLPTLVCPRCRGPLMQTPEQFSCVPCNATYPIILGIPDFRVAPDPWIGIEEDRAKGRDLAARTRNASLESTVRAYWDMTPSTSRALAERYTMHVLSAPARAEEWLGAALEAQGWRDAPWLEIGCGTADLIVAAARRGITIVGIDVAFRWLVVAKKRLPPDAPPYSLICCSGERLPFAKESFGRVVSVGTLEHCTDVREVVAEARRVLITGGDLIVKTVNRYSVLPEPHVGVLGVGFIPRRWADRFVRWRAGHRYLHHRPLSRWGLARAFRGAGFADVRVTASRLLAEERGRLGPRAAALARVYEVARRTPGVRRMLSMAAPLLEAVGVAA